jgi:hypothetical protein
MRECAKRQRKHNDNGDGDGDYSKRLYELSVNDMRAMIKLYMPYVHGVTHMKRSELCKLLQPYTFYLQEMYVAASTKGTLKSIYKMLAYDGRNSCYMDSLLTALFSSYATHWVVKRFLTYGKRGIRGHHAKHVLQTLQTLYTQMRLTASGDKDFCVLPLRNALKRYFEESNGGMEDVEWTFTQNDPNDVLQALIKILNIKEDVSVTEHTPSIIRQKKVMFNAFMIDQGLLYQALNARRVVHVRDVFPKFHVTDKTFMTLDSIKGGLYIPILRNWMDERKLKTLVTAPATIMNARLCAILIHNGDEPDSGHYTTVLRHKKQWVMYDDMTKGGVSHIIGPNMDDLWKYKKRYICKNMAGLLYLVF